ncbi:MAG: hypothetical protein HYV60_04570 [Planctomycetia bacterium]|nr:hypothetical protein [Planctomycetia bacterium]
MYNSLPDVLDSVFGDSGFLDELKQQCRSAARSAIIRRGRFVDHAAAPRLVRTWFKMLIIPHGKQSACYHCN